jgi:hypothetical protein
MDRQQHEAEVIELGTASIDTLGFHIPTPLREPTGYVWLGLLED